MFDSILYVYVYIHRRRYKSEALLQAMAKTASLYAPNVPLEVFFQESDIQKSKKKINKLKKKNHSPSLCCLIWLSGCVSRTQVVPLLGPLFRQTCSAGVQQAPNDASWLPASPRAAHSVGINPAADFINRPPHTCWATATLTIDVLSHQVTMILLFSSNRSFILTSLIPLG